MSWKLTGGLQNLRNQVNAAFPNRDRSSDGSIGDTAHQGRTSGHNPDDTAGSKPAWAGDSDASAEVRAWDMDADLGTEGVTAQELVDHVRRLPGVASVLRYIIYNRKIYHSRDGFASAAYDGANAHTLHAHFEGAWSQAADNNTTFDFQLEDLVALSAAEIKAIAKAVWEHEEPNPYDDGKTTRRMGGDLRMMEYRDDARLRSTNARVDQANASLAQVLSLVSELAGRDLVDEPAIAAAVLAGLPASAIAAAIPAGIAAEVVDEIHRRTTPAT